MTSIVVVAYYSTVVIAKVMFVCVCMLFMYNAPSCEDWHMGSVTHALNEFSNTLQFSDDAWKEENCGKT